MKILIKLAFIVFCLAMLVACGEDKDSPAPDDDQDEQADETSPRVISISPTDNSTDVSISTNISVTFSEEIDLETVNDNSLRLNTPAFSNNIEASVSISGNIMTIDPTEDLEADSEYTLTLTTSLEDAAGNGLNATFTSSFVTEFIDDVAPSVISSNPASGAIGISLNESFEITFSEEMDESTIDFRFNFTGGFSSSGTIDKQGSTITITPTNPLSELTEYTLLIYSSAEDLAGNRMESNYSLDFTTEELTLDLPTSLIGNWLDMTGASTYVIGEDSFGKFIRKNGVYYDYDGTDVTMVTEQIYQVDAVNNSVPKTFWLKLTNTDNRMSLSETSSSSGFLAFGKVVGRSVSYVKATAGNEFVEISAGVWEERTPNGDVFSFTEDSRDDWSVYMTRANGAKIQLDCYDEKIRLNGSNLYDIEEMSN